MMVGPERGMLSAPWVPCAHAQGIQHDLAPGWRSAMGNGRIDRRHDAGKAAGGEREQPPEGLSQGTPPGKPEGMKDFVGDGRLARFD